jgi:hypothetical protein
MYAAKKAGGFDLPHEMDIHCVKYFDGHPDLGGDGGAVASKLVKEFEITERRITKLATAHVDTRGRSAKDVRVQEGRMRDLSESVVQLYDDLGC